MPHMSLRGENGNKNLKSTEAIQKIKQKNKSNYNMQKILCFNHILHKWCKRVEFDRSKKISCVFVWMRI